VFSSTWTTSVLVVSRRLFTAERVARPDGRHQLVTTVEVAVDAREPPASCEHAPRSYGPLTASARRV
jgi:hypothetical protein